MDFEWDEQKAFANLRKHRVDFADAALVLFDELAITVADDSSEETRFATSGTDALGRVLVVIYTWREDRIRIISSRKATSKERKQYERKR